MKGSVTIFFFLLNIGINLEIIKSEDCVKLSPELKNRFFCHEGISYILPITFIKPI